MSSFKTKNVSTRHLKSARELKGENNSDTELEMDIDEFDNKPSID